MTLLCKAAIFHGAEAGFRIQSIQVRDPIGGELRVAVEACTLCGSDIHTARGKRSEPVPTILGHEVIGTIESFGPQANRVDARGASLSIGDRITWNLSASCGDCFFCQNRLPQKCLSLTKFGHGLWSESTGPKGGLSQYCLLDRGTTIVKIPTELACGLVCPVNCATATMMAALEASQVTQCHRILVLGGGMLGLTFAAIAKAIDDVELLICEQNQNRFQAAIDLGIPHPRTPEELSDAVKSLWPWGADLVIDTTGQSEAIELGLANLRTGGRMVCVGSVFPDRPLQVSPETIVRHCWTILGVHNYAPHHLIQALDFILKDPPRAMQDWVGTWFTLDQIDQAMALAVSSASPPRVGIVLQERNHALDVDRT